MLVNLEMLSAFVCGEGSVFIDSYEYRCGVGNKGLFVRKESMETIVLVGSEEHQMLSDYFSSLDDMQFIKTPNDLVGSLLDKCISGILESNKELLKEKDIQELNIIDNVTLTSLSKFRVLQFSTDDICFYVILFGRSLFYRGHDDISYYLHILSDELDKFECIVDS